MKKLLLPAALLLSSLPFLRSRWAWEGRGREVTLCIDGAELEAFHPGDALAPALQHLDAAGVRSVGLTWEGTEPLADLLARWETRLPSGWTVTLRPHLRKSSEGGRPWALERLPPGAPVRYVLPSGLAMTSARPPEALMTLVEGEVSLPFLDVARPTGLGRLARAMYPRVVRAHSIDEDEMPRLSAAAVQARFLRAAKERGARFFYLRFFPGGSSAMEIVRLEALAGAVRSAGFAPGLAAPRADSPLVPSPLRDARRGAAFLLAILVPWMFFRSWRRMSLPWAARPAALFGLSLCAALSVAAALSSESFLLGLDSFRGVKAALVLPLLLIAADLYGRGERGEFFKRSVTVGGAALLACMVLAALVYVLRSGHESALGASGAELRVRELLESFFGVRPRFKEFALGWPLLWLGCWLEAGKRRLAGVDGRAFLLMGMMAPLSVVNAFCHAHVPLGVSLLRAVHGFWLGALGGGILIAAAGTRAARPKAR